MKCVACGAAGIVFVAASLCGASAIVADFAGTVGGATSQGRSASGGDRTISRVVKLLQGMLDKSKADGDKERTLYGKYKCYCDDNEAAKKASIEGLIEQIGLLRVEIEGLQAHNGLLSQEAAKLTAGMEANAQARATAQGVRDSESAAFRAAETDLTDAIDQMNLAITELSEVGADQTLEKATGADHTRFMAGHGSLINLRKVVKQALGAASAFTNTKQARAAEAFLQAPFTGTYTSQSAEVVGILKDMRDTFTTNLATARATEAAAKKAHKQYMQTKLDEFGSMSESLEAKKDTLAQNDRDLSTKKDQLSVSEGAKSSDEDFLAALVEMCAAKAKDHEERTLLRRNEETALAEAIAILNSDAAFQTFGAVDATKTGETSFLQRRAIREHSGGETAQPPGDAQRKQAERLLLRATGGRPSRMLSRVVALLEAQNPFIVVLEEIKKMIALIAKEEEVDQGELTWCNSERASNHAALDDKKTQIGLLNTEISDLIASIENPSSGLNAQIQAIEAALAENKDSQIIETMERKEANRLYQEDVKHLVEAERLLDSAISVLERYYAKILKDAEASSLLQVRQPAPPATWTGPYTGQSGKGGDAITMLKFILSGTEQEEAIAHKDESDAQLAFEASMTRLKDEEKLKQTALVNLQESLAETEQTLLAKKGDLKATEAAKASIEDYLTKIKPGCDFITAQISLRVGNREKETQALKTAADLLKGTPAYQTAIAAAHNETLGGCLGTCAGDEGSAVCKACLAHVTVPAYCVGHPGTKGC
eukprot:CAMPEP_0117590732 /NCGR_PEP_ID=MMETSP0784-20121206/71139_1 /TAXON_ID=39447 /ORGANISM="" /LENGTH=770 /DNA_ID=CAMNT_0005392373 /DNA_START=60 /DNA_END=2372 /DNA_ORIENTATION=-